nr:unnamed protein product [Spirometra erinaceieuropaei]
MWFFGSEPDVLESKPLPDMRHLTRKQIRHILDLARCTVLDEIHNEFQIAFLLSESSFFITRNRIILKTCGKTTLLETLKPLTEFAYEMGFTKYVLYYSRRSYLFPELQPPLQRDFSNELKIIQPFCDNGAGYTFGRLNGDCWNFYCGQSAKGMTDEPPGQTIEIIMRDLNPQKMKFFYACNVASAKEATNLTGIAKLFPKSRLSAYLFEPCGYSVNGLMDKDDYFTVHVTPEPEFSYASFETNIALPCYIQLMTRVLEVFDPQTFICTLVTEICSQTYVAHTSLELTDTLPHYVRNELHTALTACGRKLTFVEFSREDMSE